MRKPIRKVTIIPNHQVLELNQFCSYYRCRNLPQTHGLSSGEIFRKSHCNNSQKWLNNDHANHQTKTLFIKKTVEKTLGELKQSQVLQKQLFFKSRDEFTGLLVIIAPDLIPELKKANLHLIFRTIFIVLLPDLNNWDINCVLPLFNLISFHPSQFVILIPKIMLRPRKFQIWISYENLYIEIDFSPIFKDNDEPFQLPG